MKVRLIILFFSFAIFLIATTIVSYPFLYSMIFGDSLDAITWLLTAVLISGVAFFATLLILVLHLFWNKRN